MASRISEFPVPTAWYDRLMVWASVWESWEGVPVAIGTLKDWDRIRAQLGAAFRILAQHSPADFERLRTLTRGVVVARLWGSNAEWRRSLRVCVLSTEYLRESGASAAAVAATIVHEVMHARLDAHGFEYDKNRGRIELICYAASKHFLNKLPQSSDRDAALKDVEKRLRIESAIWDRTHEITRNAMPRPLRALAFVLRWVTPGRRRRTPA